MVYQFENASAKKLAEQAVELSELRDALIEIAQIISGEEDFDG